MKFFYFLFLFFIFGCSDSSFQDIGSEENSYNRDSEKTEIIEEEKSFFSRNEIIKSCIEGCKYNYRIYTTAKSLKKDSISLNKAQLISIKNSCNFFCEKKIFKTLKVSSPKKEPKKEVTPFEEVEKKKKDNLEITPFEDL